MAAIAPAAIGAVEPGPGSLSAGLKRRRAARCLTSAWAMSPGPGPGAASSSPAAVRELLLPGLWGDAAQETAPAAPHCQRRATREKGTAIEALAAPLGEGTTTDTGNGSADTGAAPLHRMW